MQGVPVGTRRQPSARRTGRARRSALVLLGLAALGAGALAVFEWHCAPTLWGQIGSLPDDGGDSDKPPTPNVPDPNGEPALLDEAITAIEIEGNTSIPADAIMQHIRLRPGRPATKRQIDDDIRALYGTKWFVTVEPHFRRTDEGMKLIFRVIERPIVRRVEFIGNKALSTKKLEAETGLKIGSPFDVSINREACRRIERLYKDKGYQKVKVELEKGGSRQDREVVFQITEGPKIKVTWRSFEGNESFSGELLKTRLQTKAAILGLLGGNYDPDSIPNDIAALTEYYRSLGYFDVKIQEEVTFHDVNILGWEPNRENAHVKYIISEGPRYKVRRIDLMGAKVIPAEVHLETMQTKEGEYFNERHVKKDAQDMKARYGDQGRLLARVEPMPRFVDNEPGVIDLVFQIDEDKPYRIRRIDVKYAGDNPHTRRSLVWNQLGRVRPGELANPREIERTRKLIGGSGYFEANSVTVDVKPVEPGLDSIKFARGGMRGNSPESDNEPPVAPPRTATTPTAPRPTVTPPMTIRGAAPAPTTPAPRASPAAGRQQSRLMPRAGGPSSGGTGGLPPVRALPARPLPADRSVASNVGEAPGTGGQALRATHTDRRFGEWQLAEAPAAAGAFGATSAAPVVAVATGWPGLEGASPEAPAGGALDRVLRTSETSGRGFAEPPAPATPPAPLADTTLPWNGLGIGYHNEAGMPLTVSPDLIPEDSVIFRGQNYGDPTQQPDSPFFIPSPQGDPLEPGQRFAEPESAVEGAVDLEYLAEEGRTGRLMFGVGVNSSAGVVGSIVLSEQNFDITRFPTSFQDIMDGTAFRGAGQRFRIEAVPGNQVSRYLVNWTDPYFLDTDYSLGTSGYYFQRYYNDWFERREGGRFTLGRQWTPFISTSGALRIENVNVTNPTQPTPPSLARVLGNNLLTTGSLSVAFDDRDSAMLPSAGQRVVLTYEQGFGEFVYPRFEIDGRKYFTLYSRPDGGGKHIVMLAGQAGWTGNSTPIFERFYAGGFQTFRGFRFRGVGPVEGPVRVGGQFLAIGTLEYLFPLMANEMVHGVTFTDFGTVENDVSFNHFRLSVGGGFRVTIPAMGPVPLAFDFAYPLIREPFDQKQVFSFYVGLTR